MAVREVDLEIARGSIVSLIGPNGAGKTTFFNVIVGILDPTSGDVRIGGRRIIGRPVRAWLEPVVWVTPAAVIGVLTALLFAATGTPAVAALGGAIAIFALAAMFLAAIVRPPRYVALLEAGRDLPQRQAQRDGPCGDRPDLPEHPALRQHDGARERPRRDAHQAPRQRCWTHSSARRERGRKRSARRPGRRSCWPWSACGAAATSWPATCRTATSAAWRWPARWAATPRCCCSTSRRPA